MAYDPSLVAERRSKRRSAETPSATVGRVAALLDTFADADGDLGVTDLADRLGLSKSVVHRLVTALSGAAYLTRDPKTRRYVLGPNATRLGQAALGSRDIRARARPYLAKLAASTSETATLSILVGSSRLYAEQVESTQPVRQSVQIGSLAPLYAGASGKAILAFLPRHRRDTVVARIPRPTPMLASGKRLRIAALMRDLDMVRARGFAASVSERIVGATSVAAPVFDHNGEVVGAMSVASVTSRHDRTDLLTMGKVVRRYADRLSAELGSKTRA